MIKSIVTIPKAAGMSDGSTLPAGPPGPPPAHRYVGSYLQFQNPDGSWGEPGFDLDSIETQWSAIQNKPTTVAGYGITDAAPLDSPIFTGNPRAPSPATADDDTSIATTEFVHNVVDAIGTGGIVLLEEKIASASSFLTFTAGLLTSTYDDYFILFDLKPTNDDVRLVLQIESGGSFKTTGYSWGSAATAQGGQIIQGTTLNSISDAIVLTNCVSSAGLGVGNAAGEHARGRVDFSNPDATDFCLFNFQTAGMRADATGVMPVTGGGIWNTAGAVTNLRLSCNNGPIASGYARLYAVKKT